MNEYEAMKSEIRQLQDKVDVLTHDLSVARETITDVARQRDDFFESLSAERERADRLAELLDAGSPYFAHTILFDEVGSALAAHRQARGE